MNVLMTEGFDMYNGTGGNVGSGVKWSFYTNLNGGPSMGTGRFGGQCLRQGPGSASFSSSPTSSGSGAWRLASPASVLTSFSIGIALAADATAQFSEGQRVVEFWTNGLSAQFGVGFSSTGQVIIYRGANSSTTINVSSAGVFTVGVWHYMEVEAVLSTTVGTVNVYLDSSLVVNATSANNMGVGSGGFQALSVNNPSGHGSGLMYFDDIYVTDTATRLAECRVETLRPANDYFVQWAPNTGSNNFSRVNENVVDSDTSYVQTNGVGNVDYYGLGALSSTPLNIFSVNVIAFVEKTDAGTRGFSISVNSGGTISDGPTNFLGTNYSKIDRYVQTDPNTSAAWTAAGIAALKIGPKLTA